MTQTGAERSGRRSQPSFGIVVLNWNNADDTVACLAALSATDPAPRHVIVVDNGSADDSVLRIERWLAGENNLRSRQIAVQLIRAGSNRGFAGGTNLGIERLMADTDATHIVLLNNDATLTQSFFADMSRSLDELPRDAIVGPTIYEDPDRERVWYAGAREIASRALVKHLVVRPNSRIPRPTDFVTGCVMVIARGVVETIGKLSECYFPAYFEDGDYCRRAKRAGFPLFYAPEPVAYHKVGATVRAANIEIELVKAKNRLRVIYVRRNYDGVARAVALSYLVLTKPGRFVADVVLGNPRRGWAVLSGAASGFLERNIETR